MTHAHVMVIGDINIDMVIAAAEYPPEGGEAVVEKANFRPGGSGCNTSIILSKLGAEVWHVGHLGTDPFGQMASRFIHLSSVHTELIKQRGEFQTGFFLILTTSGGQRTMFGQRAANNLPPDLNEIENYSSKIDLLHISGYTLINPLQSGAILEIARHMSQKGKMISMDPGVCTMKSEKGKIKEMLPLLDFLLLSQRELADYSSPQDTEHGIQELLNQGVKAIVLKKGAQGSEYINPHQRLPQPAIRIAGKQVFDTTGAGDSFNAGFLMAVLQKRTFQDCLLAGNRAAYQLITSERGMLDVCENITGFSDR